MKKVFIIVSFLVIVLGAIFFLNTPLNKSSQASSLGRFADQNEIVGYWELVQWPKEAKSRAKNGVDPWPLPYQYFAIYPDGVLTSKMSTHYSPTTPEELDNIRQVFHSDISYTFTKGMMLVTRKDMPGYKELWGINIVTQPWTAGGIECLPGDLIMSLDDGSGKVIYYRHLRKIKLN